MKWNSLFSPFTWNSHFLSRMCVCVVGGGRVLRWNEQRRDCHYALTSLVHLSLRSLPLPCTEDLSRPPQQDRRNSRRPLSKYYTTCGVTSSGPGWFAPVISAQCVFVFFCFFVSSYAPQSPRHYRSVSRVAASMALC